MIFFGYVCLDILDEKKVSYNNNYIGINMRLVQGEI